MGCDLRCADCLSQDLQDFGIFRMAGPLLAQVRSYERLTSVHERFTSVAREIASVYERSREIVTGLLRALDGQPAISA